MALFTSHVKYAFLMMTFKNTTMLKKKNICMSNYAWKAVILLCVPLAHCAFSSSCNNWDDY